MELGCPVCNGLTELHIRCPICHGAMEDNGSLDNFLGPYSPYEEHNLYHMMINDRETEHCIHLVHCTGCGEDLRLGIARMPM